MLAIRPPGLEFRILCPEDSVIAFILSSYLCTKVALNPFYLFIWIELVKSLDKSNLKHKLKINHFLKTIKKTLS